MCQSTVHGGRPLVVYLGCERVCTSVCPYTASEQSWENPRNIPVIPLSTTPCRKKLDRNGNLKRKKKEWGRKARGVTYSAVEIQSPPTHTHTHKPVKFLPHFPHPLSSLQLAPSLSLFPLWCHVALQNAGDAASSRGCWGWSSVSKHSQSRGFGFTQMISNCFQSLSSHANRVEVHPLSLYKVDFGGDLNHKVH